MKSERKSIAEETLFAVVALCFTASVCYCLRQNVKCVIYESEVLLLLLLLLLGCG